MHALIVGGDSMIGRALADALADRNHDVTVTTRRGLSDNDSKHRQVALDLMEVGRNGAAELPGCDVALLCAAITGFAESRSRPEISELVNVTANAVLARDVAARGGRTIFLSTSAIYNGRVPQRRAADAPDGETLYGRQKAHAELLLSEADPRLAIVRPAKVLDPANRLICNWISDLGAGRTITPFKDLVTAPVGLGTAVGLICQIASSNERGVFQLSAARDVTYAEIAGHITHRLGVPSGLLEPISALEAGVELSAVPDHATLDSRRSLMFLNTPPIDPLQVVDDVFGLL